VYTHQLYGHTTWQHHLHYALTLLLNRIMMTMPTDRERDSGNLGIDDEYYTVNALFWQQNDTRAYWSLRGV